MVEGRGEIFWQHTEAAEMLLGEAQATASTEDAHQLGWIMWTGAWLLVLPSSINWLELGPQ